MTNQLENQWVVNHGIQPYNTLIYLVQIVPS